MKLVFEIGDWVLVGGQPVRVYAVHKNKIAYHFNNDPKERVCWVFINQVNVIPLSGDVFEDNGFKCIASHEVKLNDKVIGTTPDKFMYKDDTQYISVTRFDDRWNVIHTYHDGCQPTNSVMVKYAHELQHAFRLFGIDKKIQL